MLGGTNMYLSYTERISEIHLLLHDFKDRATLKR